MTTSLTFSANTYIAISRNLALSIFTLRSADTRNGLSLDFDLVGDLDLDFDLLLWRSLSSRESRSLTLLLSRLRSRSLWCLSLSLSYLSRTLSLIKKKQRIIIANAAYSSSFQLIYLYSAVRQTFQCPSV